MRSLGRLFSVLSDMRSVRSAIRFFLALGFIACVALPSAYARKPSSAITKHSIKVSVEALSSFDRLQPSRTTFGDLEWIGGAILKSSEKHFGGWSGIALNKTGDRLVAVSDAGAWMTARLGYIDGRLSRVSDAVIGPLLARNGKRLRRGRDRDAEAVVLTSGTLDKGRLLISFEQNHRIGFFKIGRQGISAPSHYIRPPGRGRRMSALKGYEAVTKLTRHHGGAILAIAERRLDVNGNHKGWMWRGKTAKGIRIKNIGGFDITDVAALDDGGVLILERRFRWLEGVKMRIRHVTARELSRGKLIVGKTLISANVGKQIDNMEGLAVHKDKSGHTVLSVLSDDNFNPALQRTLLLQFRWKRSDGNQQAANKKRAL